MLFATIAEFHTTYLKKSKKITQLSGIPADTMYGLLFNALGKTYACEIVSPTEVVFGVWRHCGPHGRHGSIGLV
ncbi:hypothetical protein [Enterovibrio sp. 27052020O]|uniref:hypothetical protein n=1 Tax=Enterovibrio sp. 27052020O TaxID=3241166 RepID=UPI00389054FF